MKTAVALTLLAGIAAGVAADALAQTTKPGNQAATPSQAAKTKATKASPTQTPKDAVAETAMVGPRLPSYEKVSVARGEKVFNEYCAVCHGLYGKGDGPRYAFFPDDQYIPDLSVADFVQGRDQELLQGIREGLRRMDEPLIVMPQFKYILSDNDIQSALAFVKTLPTHPKNRK
ncbi:MAG: cytochrome c [Rhodoplanes sp.]